MRPVARRRCPFATVFRMVRALLAALAVVLIGAAPAAAREGLLDWRIDQVGHDARSLDLIAYGDGCGFGAGGPRVEETAREIRVRMVSDLPDDAVCTMVLASYPVTVRLDGPIAARPVVGPRKLGDDVRLRGPGPARAPRLLGLAPRDALAVVRFHRLRPQVERVADLRTRPRVIGQTPRSGMPRRPGAAVTLFVSR